MNALVSATGVNPTAFHAYPPPLAKYEDVVANPKLFRDTLEKLHAIMKTKFMIPIIGGKDLDLHRLFVEVTSRGGIEKILREKRWKEVTAVFNFPSTATNASFVLRKYYYQLLNHYEQIYFFKARGWSPLPPGAMQTGACSLPIAVHGIVQPQPLHFQSPVTYQQLPFTGIRPPESTPAPGAPPLGTPVIGVIDGKFESGYLVTVTIGSEKLQGVLYQTPNPAGCSVDQPTQTNPPFAATGKRSAEGPPSMFASPEVKRRRRRRKKSEIKKRDPAHPKPNRSGYNFFFKEQHARLKPLYPGRDREISRMIGELWNKLKENERAVYQEKAMVDKERYRREMEGYREQKRRESEQQGVVGDAVPIQQRVPVLGGGMVNVMVKDQAMAMRESPYEIEDEDDDDEEDDDEDDDEMDDDEEGSSVSGEGVSGEIAGRVGGIDENQDGEKQAAVEAIARPVASSGVATVEVIARPIGSSSVIARPVESSGVATVEVIARPVGSSGVIARPVGSSGEIARPVGSSGVIARPVGSSGVIARPAGSSGEIARLAGSSGEIARLAGSSGEIARPVESSGVATVEVIARPVESSDVAAVVDVEKSAEEAAVLPTVASCSGGDGGESKEEGMGGKVAGEES